MVTEPVAILKDSKNLEAAQKFVDFVISKEGQQLVLEQGYLPAHPELPVPEGFPSRDQIKLMDFDAELALKQSEQNKQRFSEMFGAN